MAKGSARQRKKNEKNALRKQAQQLGAQRISAKATFNDLTDIVTQLQAEVIAESKRQERNNRKRELYAQKKSLIEQWGLKGLTPKDSLEKIQAAAAKAEKAAQLQAAREVKARNELLLEQSRISKGKWPKGWTKMSEDQLQAWIEKKQAGEQADRSKILSSDVWLYIGWGDKSGLRDADSLFKAGSYYGSLSNDDLRNGIAQTVNSHGIDGSNGQAGDTIIFYGKQAAVEQMLEWGEQHGYQTIFYGRELSHNALLRYTAAAIDSSPEDNRSVIVERINGYLSASGYKDLKIKT